MDPLILEQVNVLIADVKSALNVSTPPYSQDLKIKINKIAKLSIDWKHKGTGQIYHISLITNVETDRPTGWQPTAVYSNAFIKEVVWSRPLVEFLDSFEPIQKVT